MAGLGSGYGDGQYSKPSSPLCFITSHLYNNEMARPSRNIDQQLLDAGLELLPMTGCRNFSVRQLTEHAGVNLGMFHYHFKTKDNFLHAVLQRVYEEMFSQLVLQVNPDVPALTSLRNLLHVLARFARRHRRLMMTLVSEAMAGEPLAGDFLKRNVPRHLKLIGDLIRDAQRERTIVDAPPPQLIAFIVGAIAGPLLVGSALQQHRLVSSPVTAMLNAHVLSARAIDQRIEMVLRALQVDDKGKEQ